MKQPIEQRGDHVTLVAIEGQQLSAVTFVQDYIQLHFEGPTLTTITRPTVIAGDASVEYGTAGYRDQLCALIGLVVRQASVRLGDRLQIEFADGRSVSVSLRPEAYRAGEAVIFSDGETEQWASW